MHGGKKSDSPIVATKLTNNAVSAVAESVEPRGGTKGNAIEQSTPRTQSRISVSLALERIRQAVRQRPKEKLTALYHHMTVDLLHVAYAALRKEAAAGVDGVTWSAYGENLEVNLRNLHQQVHRGAYRAQPSRRRYIPKPDGKLRPLGIASLEDKIVQKAVVDILNVIYEAEFLGFSYGFRPGRGQHDALDALAVGLTKQSVSWVLDADIARFFDTVDHEWLIRFLEHRIGDRRMIHLVAKWLKTGVLEEGRITKAEAGTPQGAVISPLLANIYLHHVFDLWAQRWRQREARSKMMIVRYADDIVVGFQYIADAKCFHADMRARLAQFALALHTEKTRLIEFGQHTVKHRAERGERRPETFNFLGFTHVCAERSDGGFLLCRYTQRERMRATLRDIRDELKRRWHDPIAEQGQWLRKVMAGYFAYHAVPTNIHALHSFRDHVAWLWMRRLRRRSQTSCMTWARFNRLCNHWLPPARILHPYPQQRFAVRHPR
jgi:group II intron reverse transcriptase/maturase